MKGDGLMEMVYDVIFRTNIIYTRTSKLFVCLIVLVNLLQLILFETIKQQTKKPQCLLPLFFLKFY